jgi:hypothetical protein
MEPTRFFAIVIAFRRLRRFLRAAPVRLGLGAALLIFFVAAEGFDAAHAADFKAHQDGQPCKICVAAASLASASVGKTTVFVPEAAAVCVCSGPFRTFFSADLPRPSARGPPSAP